MKLSPPSTWSFKARIASTLVIIWIAYGLILFVILHMPGAPREGFYAFAGLLMMFTIALPLLYRYRPPRLIQEERRQLGQCIYCGYDLRETPTRCPECGKIPNYARIDVNH